MARAVLKTRMNKPAYARRIWAMLQSGEVWLQSPPSGTTSEIVLAKGRRP